MTRETAFDSVLENIEDLRKAYPEQDRLINELYNCATYYIYDSVDAMSYMHEIDKVMSQLFDIIDNENFDDRDLSDKDFAEVITNIKRIAENIDISIYEYVQYVICDYRLYD